MKLQGCRFIPAINKSSSYPARSDLNFGERLSKHTTESMRHAGKTTFEIEAEKA